MRHFAAVLILVATSAVGQTPPAPAIVGIQVPTVFDADGNAIGQLLTVDDSNGTGSILFKLAEPDAAVTIKIKRRGADVSWSSVPAFFSLPDCRGVAAVLATTSLSDYAGVVDADGNLHVADMTSPPAPLFQMESEWTTSGDCRNTNGGGIFNGAIVMQKKLKLSDHFKTPLRVDNFHRARVRATGP